jgi:hypothetical protein
MTQKRLKKSTKRTQKHRKKATKVTQNSNINDTKVTQNSNKSGKVLLSYYYYLLSTIANYLRLINN